MVFKGRFFSSSKKSSDSDGSPSSPRTPTLNSPNRSEKKKVKSDPTAGASSSGTGRQTLLKDATRQQQQKKDKGKGLVSGKDKDAAVPAKPKTKGASPGGGSLSPIMASSLGLNRIKTRSGPLPMERTDRGSSLGPSKLARGPLDECSTSSSALGNSVSGRGTTGKKKLSGSLQKVPEMHTTWWSESDKNPIKAWGASASGDFKSVPIGQSNSSWNQSARQIDAQILEAESPFDAYGTPKESESPRFKAIMQVTSAPQKKFPADIKSFSHELNSKGVRPYPFWKPRGKTNLKEVLKVIHVKFEKAKEEVNSDLATFAGELVGVMENNAETHPDWKETLEDLLLLARSCVVTSPGDFWLQCEGIVQDLDDQRQELQTGVLKKLHTRMLFILTRCTRLLQFHKESVFAEDEIGVENLASSITHFSERKASEPVWDGKSTKVGKSLAETASARKSYSQEHGITSWRKSHEICPSNFFPTSDVDVANNPVSSSKESISSWKPLPSPTVKIQRETAPTQSVPPGIKEPSLQIEKQTRESTKLVDLNTAIPPELPTYKDVHPSAPPKHEHKTSWGYWGDQQAFNDEEAIMCRICEENVPTSHVENHLKVCTIADRCDEKGLSVDERLIRIAETLEKMVDLCSQTDPQNSAGSPDVVKANSSITEESDIPSPKLGEWSRPGSADMLDCFQEADNTLFMDDLKGLSTITCKTRFGQKSDQGMATSSAGSMTPRSPLLTPRTGHIDTLLAGKGAYESEDLPQECLLLLLLLLLLMEEIKSFSRRCWTLPYQVFFLRRLFLKTMTDSSLSSLFLKRTLSQDFLKTMANSSLSSLFLKRTLSQDYDKLLLIKSFSQEDSFSRL